MEGCGDQNGKMCCGNSLEKFFFFFFLRAGGKGGSQKSLGVSISSWLSVKGQDLQDLINSVNLRTIIPKRF